MEDEFVVGMYVNIFSMNKIVQGLRLLQIKEPSTELDAMVNKFEAVLNEAIFRDALNEIGKILEDPKKCETCGQKETCFPKICSN